MSILEKIKQKKGKKWLLLYFLLFFNFVAIEIIIMFLSPYYGDLNLIVSNYAGFYLNLVLIAILLVLLPLIYGAVLIYLNMKRIIKNNEIDPRKIHKILPIFLIILINAAVMLLMYFLEEYSKLIFQILEFYSIYIFLTITIGLIFLLYPLFKIIPNLKSSLSNKGLTAEKKNISIILLIIAGYIIAFISPIIFIPANVIYGDLPTKPDIIGHRGGAHIGPENTIEVAEVALDYDIVGWEVDIAISYDGVPFIMHDDTLKRTTDVEEIFPDRKSDRMDSFKWKDLRKLNAGSWYVELDPWGLIARGIITKEQIEKYNNAKIPSFEEVLNFTRDNDLILDFDTRFPPEDHPYHAIFMEILLNMTIDSSIDLSKIMIPTSSEEWLDLIESRGAIDIWTYENYYNTGDVYTNAEYLAFYEDDFPIMVYTIDSIERFCQLWCLGVTWVKTNAPHKFMNINNPIWYLSIQSYILIWIIIYITGITSAIVIKFILKNKKDIKDV